MSFEYGNNYELGYDSTALYLPLIWLFHHGQNMPRVTTVSLITDHSRRVARRVHANNRSKSSQKPRGLIAQRCRKQDIRLRLQIYYTKWSFSLWWSIISHWYISFEIKISYLFCGRRPCGLGHFLFRSGIQILTVRHWGQGWGQFRFCNSNSNSNSGIFRFYNSNSNSRAYNSNSNSNSRSSIPIPIPIQVTRWNQYAASIHIHIIIVRLRVQYGKNTNNIMNKTHREY